MKLFQVMASNKRGGAERFFCHLAHSFQEQKLDQSLLVRHNSPYIPQLQENTSCYSLPFSGSLDFSSKKQLRHLIDQHSPNIVLSWMTRATNLIGKLHRHKQYQHVARLGGYYDLKKYAHCDHFIVNTKDLANYLIKSNVPTNLVHYISNFVDETIGKPIARPNDRPLLVALGRLHENKAFDTLIQSLAKVPDAELWIAGDGPESVKLQTLIKTLNLNDRVKLIGWHAHPEDLIATADLFICPSRHEPLGNVILEAWFQKKPILASRSQGACELITHEENGYLVPIDNPAEFTKAISHLLSHPKEMQMIADNGYHSYQQNFSKNIITQQYIDFFNQLV